MSHLTERHGEKPDPPKTHAECRQYVVAMMRWIGTDGHASTEPPIIQTPYTKPPFICPHGTRFWVEPTSDQIAQWAKDGVR